MTHTKKTRTRAVRTHSIAGRIRATRKKLGVTQETLARMIGCSLTTVNRWENSQGAPGTLHTVVLDALHDVADNPNAGPKLEKTTNTRSLSYTIYTLLNMVHHGKRQKHE